MSLSRRLAGKAGAADTQGPVQPASSCVSRTGSPGLLRAQPRGWEHVGLDSIKSSTMDLMKVQNKVRAGQRGCKPETAEKWAQGRRAEQQVYGEGDEPRAWTWEEEGRG